MRRSANTALIGALLFSTLAVSAARVSAQPAQLDLQGGSSALCPSPDQLSLERPGSPTAATEVGLGLLLMDLARLDDVNQVLTTDIYLLLQWTDPRLADPARGESSSVCGLAADRVWMPLVQVQGVRRFAKHYQDVVLIDAEGRVTQAQRFDLDLAVSLDLRRFPFDRQTLAVDVLPVFSGIGEVDFVVLEDLSGAAPEANLTGWTLDTPRASVDVRPAPRLGVDQARFRLEVEIAREAGFYVVKALVPLTLIVFMSWLVFWIDPKDAGPQIGLAATSMLTLIAYQFAFIGVLPRISYLTIADRLTLGSLLLVFLALVEALVATTLARSERRELALRLDRLSRVAFPVGLGLVLLWAFSA